MIRIFTSLQEILNLILLSINDGVAAVSLMVRMFLSFLSVSSCKKSSCTSA